MFIIDAGADEENVVIRDPEEIEAHPDVAVFQWLTVECGRLFEFEDDGHLVSESASELIEEEEVTWTPTSAATCWPRSASSGA